MRWRRAITEGGELYVVGAVYHVYADEDTALSGGGRKKGGTEAPPFEGGLPAYAFKAVRGGAACMIAAHDKGSGIFTQVSEAAL